jgi:uncharacterized protein with HEPN domain
MRLECLKYLHDIRQACERLGRFVAAKDYADFVADDMLRSAVERQLEIIGEATGQMVRLEPEMGRHISGAGQIVAFRNHLIHRYAQVSAQLVWGVLQEDVPRLLTEVEALLGADGAPEGRGRGQ